jgi:hypothetical protein
MPVWICTNMCAVSTRPQAVPPHSPEKELLEREDGSTRGAEARRPHCA